MDYKYIEQLLERYWECQTTLEEEAILRQFFAQDDIPASLLPYRDIFAAQQQMVDEAHLGADFDERVLQLAEQVEADCVKATRVTLSVRLRPLFRATAVVAIVLTLGMAAQHRWTSEVPDAPTGVAQADGGDSVPMPEMVTPASASLQTLPVTDTLAVAQ
ncbi:MAG: pyruvate ferredoxin oxidoreductase [Bacteroidaceae bacterium]|nr:pyruvate ferredoxin oxidoreductase [Bacteroidaceae bacterium]MCF0199426.1 pyruvate ferredoxin oxidoreductase [Bacteroidaceae bacterium]